MIDPAIDRGGLKDSENDPNSIFPKINQTVFWRLGTDMLMLFLFFVCSRKQTAEKKIITTVVSLDNCRRTAIKNTPNCWKCRYMWLTVLVSYRDSSKRRRIGATAELSRRIELSLRRWCPEPSALRPRCEWRPLFYSSCQWKPAKASDGQRQRGRWRPWRRGSELPLQRGLGTRTGRSVPGPNSAAAPGRICWCQVWPKTYFCIQFPIANFLFNNLIYEAQPIDF